MISQADVDEVLRLAATLTSEQPADPARVVTYELRTPRLYWPVVVAITALSAALFVPLQLTVGPLASAALLALPLFYVALTPEYRARGAMKLSLTSIDVPDARGRVQRFTTKETTIAIRAVVVRYLFAGVPMGDVQRGHVIELRCGGRKRALSTLALAARHETDALLHDLARLQIGLPPAGSAAPSRPAHETPSRDAYDDRLDDELAKM